jgi:hypothetical protein
MSLMLCIATLNIEPASAIKNGELVKVLPFVVQVKAGDDLAARWRLQRGTSLISSDACAMETEMGSSEQRGVAKIAHVTAQGKAC